MAWVFGLSVECGPVRRDALAVAAHFELDEVTADDGGAWWCTAAPAGLSRSGIRDAADAAAMTAHGHRLYERLRTAPPRYRYALAGVETDLFRTYDELLAEDRVGDLAGLVLADRLWSALGGPAGFDAFAPAYRWIPYRGETVRQPVRPGT